MQFDTTSEWGTWAPKGVAKFALDTIRSLPVNPICKRLAFLLRKPVKKGRQPFYDVSLWGYRLRLSAKGNLSEQRWLTMPQFHDAEERELIASKLSGGGVFFDIGANAGFYTFWVLSRQRKDVSLYAVEPCRLMQERLRYNLSLNALEESLCLIECAVTAQPCEVHIQEHADNLGQTSISESGQGYAVRGMPLLELMDAHSVGRIDVLKIDIEGGEADVLEALFEAADSNRWPTCIVGEIIGEDSLRFKTMLKSRGYQMEFATKMNGGFSLSDC